MSKEKMEKELAAIATERSKALKGLSRRDRDKMQKITADFHLKREAIMKKYKDAEDKVPAEEKKPPKKKSVKKKVNKKKT